MTRPVEGAALVEHLPILEQKSELSVAERLRRRQAESRPIMVAQRAELLARKEVLLPKHLLAGRQIKRIALPRNHALVEITQRGGGMAAIRRSLTSPDVLRDRRHEINPQTYITELLANLDPGGRTTRSGGRIC